MNIIFFRDYTIIISSSSHNIGDVAENKADQAQLYYRTAHCLTVCVNRQTARHTNVARYNQNLTRTQSIYM